MDEVDSPSPLNFGNILSTYSKGSCVCLFALKGKISFRRILPKEVGICWVQSTQENWQA